MTDAPLPPDEALEEGDITLAMTPGQLIAALVGLWLLFKVIRALRR